MGHAATTEHPEYNTDMPVGEILKRAREHYGQSLDEVEKNLRIRAIQLSAIEEGDIDALPGRVYAIGFVRSYAEYLGFDPEKMVQLFKAQDGGQRPQPKLSFPVPASESRLPNFILIVLCAGLALFIAGYIVSYSYSGEQDINVIPEVEETLNAQKQTASITGADVHGPVIPDYYVPPVKKDKPVGIILNVVQNSWVEIRDSDGNKLVSQVLKAGDQYRVPDRPDLYMTLGNAAGVELIVDDLKVPPLGARGQVRRRVPLDAKSLKELAQSR